jgi:hypothetical protein
VVRVAAILILVLSAAGGAQAARLEPLVSMRQNNGQVFETVSIGNTGATEVGVFIGETTGVHYKELRLSAAQLGHLRSLLANARSVPQAAYLGKPSTLPFVNDVTYVIGTPGDSWMTAAGHAPPRLQGLVTYLSGLIDRYSQAATTSTRRKPLFGDL